MKKKVYLVQASYRKMDRSVVKGSSMIINCTLNVPMLLPTVPHDWEVSTCLENFDEIDFSNDASVIFLSTTSSDMVHAYRIAERFRSQGKRIFFGGHSDAMSVEIMKMVCDAVYFGVPDASWTKMMLDDALENNIQQEYHCGINIDFPFDYSVYEGEKIDHLIVVSSIGCKHRCDYCQHQVQYDGIYKLRDIDHVIGDLKSISKYTRIAAFRDANFYNDRDHTLALCDRIISEGLNMKWGAQCPVYIGKDKEVLQRMHKAGCKVLFIGYESLNQDNLVGIHKPSRVDKFREYTKNIRDSGMHIVGYFMFGFDQDTAETFRDVYSFVNETGLALPLLNIYTPIPGTRLFDRLREEGRVQLPPAGEFVEKDIVFSIPCGCCHFTPKRVPAAELEEGFMDLYRKFTSYRQIIKRSLKPSLFDTFYLLIMNLNMRFERRKLELARDGNQQVKEDAGPVRRAPGP